MNVPTLTTGTAAQLSAHSTHLQQLQSEVKALLAIGVTEVSAAAQAVAIHVKAEAGLVVTYVASHRAAQYALATFFMGIIIGLLLGSHI